MKLKPSTLELITTIVMVCVIVFVTLVLGSKSGNTTSVSTYRYINVDGNVVLEEDEY